MRRADPALPLVLAAGAVGAGLLGTWVLDDAGISMAYALSLADGHGLLAQPGGSAAEGYSNPLWVLLLSAPLALFGAPVATAKALGAITWVATLLLWARVLGPASQGARVAGLALLALHPAVLVWAFSGMENGLTALLCVALVASWQQAGQGTRGAAGADLQRRGARRHVSSPAKLGRDFLVIPTIRKKKKNSTGTPRYLCLGPGITHAIVFP